MASSATELSRQLRLALQASSEAPTEDELLAAINVFVLDCSEPSSADLFHDFENELESIHDENIDYDDLAQVETFLSVLYHLRPVLPPSSLISTWFDLALRPALREPKLSARSVLQAEELIIAALDSGPPGAETQPSDAEQDKRKEKVGDFWRRLMDLYLLDAHNESSGDDVLEWAELDADQREKKACWKANLEDVLVRAGLERPQDFLRELYHCFISPSSRLQLLILFSAYTSQANFHAIVPILATHPLLTSLLHCLLFDNLSTVCAVALSVLTKLLPIFAVKACEDVKRHLPQLFAVLARIVCWKERSSPTHDESMDDFVNTLSGSPENFSEEERASTSWPPIREDVEWERLEQTFLGPASAPSAHRYFTFLYYLFPCNTIRFMRYPIAYLHDSGLESPYAVDWNDALDEEKIRSKCEPLLRGHVLHPLLIWRGPVEELSQPDFWAQYDIERIVGDATMLDTRNASLGLRERDNSLSGSQAGPSTLPPNTDDAPAAASPGRESFSADRMSTISLAAPGSKPRVSLQDMIATSVALKSGLDIDIINPSPAWSGALFPQAPRTRSPSREVPVEQAAGPANGDADAESVRPASEREPARGREDVPSHVAQALAGLQREVLTLRNELNLELWMARENVRHLGRLYEDRVLSKTAEFERQGLHNKMREYKAEVFRLQKELKDHKEQTVTVKGHFADWNRKLQDKLTEFRNEKKSWTVEAAAMRAADKEAKDTFKAQGKLLEEATQRVFQLETKIKENAHKVDRLHDYETQIDQLIKLQRLWETDVQKLNGQAEYLQAFTSKYRKMELRLECQEKTQADMRRCAQNYRQQIRTLETKLAVAQKQIDSAKNTATLARLSTTQAEYKKLAATNERLRDENSDLRDEAEEVKAMVDYLRQEVKDLRTQVAGSRPTSESPRLEA